jgi:hypothetical protein
MPRACARCRGRAADASVGAGGATAGGRLAGEGTCGSSCGGCGRLGAGGGFAAVDAGVAADAASAAGRAAAGEGGGWRFRGGCGGCVRTGEGAGAVYTAPLIVSRDILLLLLRRPDRWIVRELSTTSIRYRDRCSPRRRRRGDRSSAHFAGQAAATTTSR